MRGVVAAYSKVENSSATAFENPPSMDLMRNTAEPPATFTCTKHACGVPMRKPAEIASEAVAKQW